MQILDAVKFNTEHLIRSSFWSKNRLKVETLARQKATVQLLNGNNHLFDSNELFQITGNPALLSLGYNTDNNLRAVNWSIEHGGLINISNISYDDWIEVWIARCEQSGDCLTLKIMPIDQQSLFDNWLNTEAIILKKLGKLKIGGNSGKRSWFLSLLYTVIGQPILLKYLSDQIEHSKGSRMLYKLLVYLKASVQEQRYKSQMVVTQFTEALLIGHYYWWKQSVSVEAAFELLGVMSDNLLQNFAVSYDVWCPCPKHIIFNLQNLKAVRLSFDTPVQWDADSGDFSIDRQNSKPCLIYDSTCNSMCLNRITERIFHIKNLQDELFVVYFKDGIPQNLWSALLKGELVQVGRYHRQVINAIFVMNISKLFMCAYLLDNPIANATQRKKWVQFNTQTKFIMNFVRVQSQSCKFVFFGPPPMNVTNCDICHKRFHINCYVNHICDNL